MKKFNKFLIVLLILFNCLILTSSVVFADTSDVQYNDTYLSEHDQNWINWINSINPRC